jgi:hypothetical protein
MAEETLLVTAGDVIEVQLTSETVVIEGADVRHVEPGHITNRMRLFVHEIDGRERKYDFDDTELGVRETQRVAIVRGRVKRAKEPVNLLLFNLSSGEHDTFEDGLAAYLARKPIVGAVGKAVLLSALVALITWVVPRLYDIGYEGLLGVGLAIMFGLIGFPVFLPLCRVWDRVSERIRYKRARARFIAEMTGRVRAYAPGGAQPASQSEAAPMAQSPPAAEPSGA